MTNTLQADRDRLFAILVAENEVARAALKALCACGPSHEHFEKAFRAEVEAILVTLDRANRNAGLIAQVMAAARDRLLSGHDHPTARGPAGDLH